MISKFVIIVGLIWLSATMFLFGKCQGYNDGYVDGRLRK